MKRFCSWAAFFVALYVIQVSLLPLIAFHGVTADLLLIAVVSLSFQRGGRLGGFVGFCAGLLQDLTMGSFFGINCLAKMLVGYTCGSFSKQVTIFNWLSVLLSTLVHYGVWLVCLLLMGYRLNLGEHLRFALLPMLLFNVLFAWPVNACVIRVCDLLYEDSAERHQLPV